MEAIVTRSPSRWANLPPDLLLEVSGRLHDASDLVRFHAVCQSWRDADLSPAMTSLQPCLLARRRILVVRHHLDFPCVGPSAAESSNRRCELFGVPFRHGLLRNWVANADGTAVFFLKVSDMTLIDAITGAITTLPPLPPNASSIAHPKAASRGIVYSDGTVFLYNVEHVLSTNYNHYKNLFTAAILRPGDDDDARWVVVQRSFNLSWSNLIQDLLAVLHDGNVVLCMASSYCTYVMTIDGGGDDDVVTPLHPLEGSRSVFGISDPICVLECGGELLWVTLKYDWSVLDLTTPCPSMSVLVHALELAPEATRNMRWVRREGRSLSDRVLFLGFPYSFAMDAARLGVAGGCAYFWFGRRLMRCDLVNGETTCLKLLSSANSAGKYMKKWAWLRPQLAVAPIDDIRERIKARNSKELVHYKPTTAPPPDIKECKVWRRRRRVDYLSKFMGIFTKCVKF